MGHCWENPLSGRTGISCSRFEDDLWGSMPCRYQRQATLTQIDERRRGHDLSPFWTASATSSMGWEIAQSHPQEGLSCPTPYSGLGITLSSDVIPDAAIYTYSQQKLRTIQEQIVSGVQMAIDLVIILMLLLFWSAFAQMRHSTLSPLLASVSVKIL